MELFATGYFPALHGYFFVDQSNRLHVYRVLPAVLNPKSQQFETRPEDDELKPKWKGEPFYHEIYVLEEGEWLPKIWGVGDPRGAREFSKAPEHYLSFEPCDRNDALDLQRKDLKGALGAGTKIKDVVEFQKYAAVIYSIDPKTLSGTSQPFKPGDRPVWLALLKKNRTRWEYSGVTKSVSLGDYCGKATLFSLRAGISRPVLLLFFREGALNVAYSYVADDD